MALTTSLLPSQEDGFVPVDTIFVGTSTVSIYMQLNLSLSKRGGVNHIS